MHQAAPLPADEGRRLARLHALQVLDTAPEPLFDALTQAASLLIGAPMATVTLVDADRQWFKANVGMGDTTETTRDLAFCAHAILGDDVLEVNDARQDARFEHNALVTGDPNIRFYAGAPIKLRDGLNVGTLCVIDTVPRTITDEQRAILVQLARAASEALEQRVDALQRAQALEASADAGAQLSRVVEATGAGTCEWNVSTGELRVNDRWLAICGRARTASDDHSADPWLEALHADDRQGAADALQKHFRGDTPDYDVEVRVLSPDGHERWVRDRGRAANVAAGSLWMFGTRVDVTTRKHAEIALAANEAMLERTAQLSGVGGWELDLATQKVTWSDETCRLHDRSPGYQPTLDEGISYYEPSARTRIRAAVDTAMAGGDGWDLELPLVSATGRAFWGRSIGAVEFSGDGTPVRISGAFQDITLQRRATQAMEQSERRFRKLFQYSLGLICTHDLRGVLLSVNPAAARSLGYSVAELMGCSLGDFMLPEHRAGYAAYLAQIAKDGNASGMLRLVARDGSRRTWEYHNILDDETDDPYVLGHAQDISERQKQVQQLMDWSVRDSLTGAFNRRYLDGLSAAMTEADRWGCIAIDLDRFKRVNDTYGHQRGDQVLVAFAQFLQRHVRPEDVVVRAGGDEFVLLLRHADRVLTSTIAARLRSDADAAPIGFTMGTATRHRGVSLDDALAEADRALYAQRATRDDD